MYTYIHVYELYSTGQPVIEQGDKTGIQYISNYCNQCLYFIIISFQNVLLWALMRYVICKVTTG